ncbi:MAG: hypothetical protein ACD_47C00047G0002 [uncultured bacterium]|nr:MAG: hypothetical protein ACD_47C00047G0002 [uncultured bacterium]HBC74400.1 hypothetical protein [Candidatus Wallbacteria bacterium]
MKNKIKFIIYSIIITGLAAPFMAGSFPGADGKVFAASGRSVFDNGCDVVKYKKTVKKDIFYLPDEKFTKDFEISSSRPKIETAQQNASKLKGGGSYGAKSPADESFRVEAIIKIGEKGCAIINSKIWYVGKNSFGYMLTKLNEESVEIKTPAGNIIKCDLIKKKAVETIDE